jgi:hypothetical protein
VKVERDEIRAALTAEVLKRDVTEGEQSDLAKKKVAKAASKKIVKSASKHVPIDTSHNFSDDETGDVIADAQDSLS